MRPFVLLLGAVGLITLVSVAILGLVSGPDGERRAASTQQAGVSIPEATNYAVDAAGVLQPAELETLNSTLKAHAESGQEIGVLVVKTTAPLALEEYGIRAAEKWRVGNKQSDSGVLFLVATEDRKIRIEVGTGAEADLTDAEASRIISDVIGPRFKAGDWNGGITEGVKAIYGQVSAN